MTESEPANQIFIAFDFGMKRIGVAIGQTVTKTARPLTTLAAIAGVPDWKAIEKIFSKWQPNAVIVGIPFNMDGSEQNTTQLARLFARQLKEHFHLDVHEMDERLTTKTARERLFTLGGFKALQDGQVDQVAAQLILQNWFNENK